MKREQFGQSVASFQGIQWMLADIARILPYLERVRDELCVPIVYVTHDPAEARQLADQIIVLEQGQVVPQHPLL